MPTAAAAFFAAAFLWGETCRLARALFARGCSGVTRIRAGGAKRGRGGPRHGALRAKNNEQCAASRATDKLAVRRSREAARSAVSLPGSTWWLGLRLSVGRRVARIARLLTRLHCGDGRASGEAWRSSGPFRLFRLGLPVGARELFAIVGLEHAVDVMRECIAFVGGRGRFMVPATSFAEPALPFGTSNKDQASFVLPLHAVLDRGGTEHDSCPRGRL